MNAEILCVGTELLLGDIVNTNAAHIAAGLAAAGVGVQYQTVVGDNPERLKKAIALAFTRADAVIMTGGLGPTYDDLTKETVAEWFGMPMERDDACLAEIEEYFKSTGRTMTENNKKQAMIPKGAKAIKNDNGTAPGIFIEKDGKTAVLLPGPPSEMKPMFDERVLPLLKKDTGRVIVSHTVNIYGVGESRVEDILKEKMVAMKNPTLAPYAKPGEVRLRVTAAAATDAEAEEMIAPVVRELRQMFGENAYAEDAVDVCDEAVRRLLARGISIATAESCTGGLISKKITDVPGVSAIFGTGVCSYANETKEKLLGVKSGTLAAHGAVSAETAAEMAEGVRRISGADIGVSTTGVAGPDGGTDDKPVGLVYIGVATKDGTKTVRFTTSGMRGRAHVREMAAKRVFFEVIRLLGE